jgi:rRNA maturation endonuclease Nob1
LAASSTAPAIIGAVNEGGDTDTTAAIAGAVAGARHGASSLPQSWLETLDDADTLRTLADRLAEETIKIDEEIIDRNFDVPDHTIRCPECEESLVDRTAPQYCPDCGTNVPEEAAYCPGCGGELVRCPACAATLGVSPQFCPACGSRVGGGT